MEKDKNNCCKTCKHYQSDFGECWANPPVAQMIAVPERNPITGEVKMGTQKWTFFPQLKRDMIGKIRCGAYATRLEVAQ